MLAIVQSFVSETQLARIWYPESFEGPYWIFTSKMYLLGAILSTNVAGSGRKLIREAYVLGKAS